jgi:hypothetical protein
MTRLLPATRRGVSDPVVRFAHRGSPQLLKRREFVRATVGLPLTPIAPGADEEVVTADAQALDLSGPQFTELDEAGRIRLTQLGFTMSRDQRRSID